LIKEIYVIADLDTLLIALYVELTDRIIPSLGTARRGPGRPQVVSDAELVCLAVAQVLLRHDDERHWLRSAPARIGHLFPRLLSQPEYNARLKSTAGLMEAALRWLAARTPSSAELLRLMDGTPVRCGASRATAIRSDLAGVASYGHDASHHCFYWGAKLMLTATADGVITAFALASPKLAGERDETLAMFGHAKNLPPAGTVIVADKGFAGQDFETSLTQLGLHLIRPARKDEPPRAFPGWLRQRVEAIIWTLKGQLGLTATGAASPLACGPASSSASSPSTQRSGTTGPSAPQSSDPSPPTTTDLPRFPDQRSRVEGQISRQVQVRFVPTGGGRTSGSTARTGTAGRPAAVATAAPLLSAAPRAADNWDGVGCGLQV
jgi:hypothetical protein